MNWHPLGEVRSSGWSRVPEQHCGMSPHEIRMAYARSRAFSVKELCLMEDSAIRERMWSLAEQCRWAIAERCVEGGRT